MSEKNMLEAALWYAQGGWHVFPLIPGDKRPITPNGFKDATTDAEPIRRRWSATPDANIGIACGASGLLVLDFDVAKPDYAGADLLAELRGGDAYPPTATAQTGGGGYHLVYRQPDGAPLGNSRGALPAGVDVRGDGGYIVAPPSLHKSGRRYQWIAWPHGVKAQPLPEFVAVLLRDSCERLSRAAVSTNGTGTPYAIAALHNELDLLARTAEGNRNEQLNRAAFNLGQLVGGGGLQEFETAQKLADTAYTIGLEEREVAKTIESGIEAGKKEPRGAPIDPVVVYAKPALDGNGAGPEVVDVERLTDLGNARRFARLHGQDLRWVFEWSWLVWTGSAWEFDRTGEVMRRAKQTAVTFFGDHLKVTERAEKAGREAEAAALEDDTTEMEGKAKKAAKLHGTAKTILDHARKCQSRARLDAMIALAQSERPIPVLASEFDNTPWLLNVLNGTIDLRTGHLQNHDRTDLLTMAAPVAYDPEAKCPTWNAFLARIMAGNRELQDFLQRVIGYSLTGDVSEQKLFFAWGTGANGKSTFINTVLDMLGRNYSAQAAPELLTIGRDRHPTELADLRGKRLVASIEVDQGKRLAEGLVKQLTGGDKVKARYMRQDFFEFDPTHKLILVANHKPVIRGTDHAIWRRICLVPFAVTIPDAEQDKTLPAKLAAELPGILAWAVRGCLQWQRFGLDVPETVKAATETYRNESDTLGCFLSECTEEGETYQAKAGELYSAYGTWCDQNGEKAVTSKTFATQLAERGFDKYKSNYVYYIGLELVNPENFGRVV